MIGFYNLNKRCTRLGRVFSLAFCLMLIMPLGMFAQNRPSWVSSRPINTMYYIGIGYASKSETDYMKVAKQKALSDLVSEIEVKVASNSLLNSVEDNGKLSTFFKESIQVEAQKNIDDFQLVESWENAQDYWVYYQLNKYDYQEKERLRLERIQEKAFNYLQKANEHKLSGKLAAALFNYMEGLKVVQKDLNKNLPFQNHGQNIYLGNELYQGLSELFQGVSLVVDPSSVKAQSFKGVEDPVDVRLNRGGKPISNMPLKFEFVSGSGDLNSGVLSNAHGQAQLQILNVTSKQTRQLIRIAPDLQKLCSGNGNQLVRQLIRTIRSVPQAEVELRLESPTLKAYLRSGEASESALTRSLKRLLTNNYFNFVPNESMADVVVELKEEFRRGGTVAGEMYNMKEYFYSLSLQLINRRSREAVFNYSDNDLRSLAPESTSESTARMSASRNILKKLQRKIIPELKKLHLDIQVAEVVLPQEVQQEPTREEKVISSTAEPLVTSGLLAYYTFDDGTTNNRMGLDNYNALPQGNNKPSYGESGLEGCGKTLQFKGNSYLSLPEHPIQSWSAYSINTWVKTTSGGAVLGRSGYGATILGTTLQNHLFYQKKKYGGYVAFDFDANKLLLDGKWHMLTLTVEILDYGSRSRIFVDGQLVLVENTRMHDRIRTGERGFIGYDPGGDRYFTGDLDNLRIYNRSLRAEEIKLLYAKHQ